jgi:hypothetical protein
MVTQPCTERRSLRRRIARGFGHFVALLDRRHDTCDERATSSTAGLDSPTKGTPMKPDSKPETKSEADETRRYVREAGGGVVGAIGGAGLGVMAGPPGVVAGAVIGGVVGALTTWALDANNAEVAAADQKLDEEIGVSGGDIGVASLKHPPATRGAYSAASVGVSGAEPEATAEGPISPPAD